jgi:hypothetical protein
MFIFRKFNFLNLRFQFLVPVFLLIVFCSLFFVSRAEAASLSLSPTTGTFTVGSTFDVSILLDTQNESINTIVSAIKFPSDKLQLVSPTTGKSIIDIWLTPPKFNNQTGVVELKGGIPNGINVSNGLVTKLTFRVTGVGRATMRFLDSSRVLLNDGLGTEVLQHTQSAIYSLALPPPAGPIVVSSTHPDQSTWYSNPNAVLEWTDEVDVEAYSYILNRQITDTPDDIADEHRHAIMYKNLPDGRHYFHIKAMRKGIWGGITHFVVNVDTEPPADFPINIIPDSKTTKRQPVIQFSTTDNLSGIDYYEIKRVSLNPTLNDEINESGFQPLFVEITSPYILPELDLGAYDIIIRAHDKAGNYRESVERLEIVNPVFKFIADEGIEIKGRIVIGWLWFWIVGFIIVVILGFIAWKLRNRHVRLEGQRVTKELPSDVKSKLDELQKYRERYGKMMIFLLFATLIVLSGNNAIAQEPVLISEEPAVQIELGPPLITTISRNISNEEIFYVGGKTEAANTEVIIYLQCLQTGETSSFRVTSDKRGDWFYRHSTFLTSGNYVLWTQSKIADRLSPPSPQLNMSVRATAIQFGASRISYETFYLGIIIILFILLVVLASYIIFHAYHLRRKQSVFMKEIKEAEEAIKRGFAVLRRDIQAELAVVKEAKMNKELAAEARQKERQLLEDLEEVERHIGKEVFDIEKAEYVFK